MKRQSYLSLFFIVISGIPIHLSGNFKLSGKYSKELFIAGKIQSYHLRNAFRSNWLYVGCISTRTKV